MISCASFRRETSHAPIQRFHPGRGEMVSIVVLALTGRFIALRRPLGERVSAGAKSAITTGGLARALLKSSSR
jgi:hypothetical protein